MPLRRGLLISMMTISGKNRLVRSIAPGHQRHHRFLFIAVSPIKHRGQASPDHWMIVSYSGTLFSVPNAVPFMGKRRGNLNTTIGRLLSAAQHSPHFFGNIADRSNYLSFSCSRPASAGRRTAPNVSITRIQGENREGGKRSLRTPCSLQVLPINSDWN